VANVEVLVGWNVLEGRAIHSREVGQMESWEGEAMKAGVVVFTRTPAGDDGEGGVLWG
jgi:hypothetical protein